jgi:hypothetical protein
MPGMSRAPGVSPSTSAERSLATSNPHPWNPSLVSLGATSEVVVIDPEDGRACVRSNERHIVDRAGGARGLGRLIAALDEYGTVRNSHDHDARVVTADRLLNRWIAVRPVRMS